MANLEILDPAKHAALTISDGAASDRTHLVPVLATELRELAIEMPVVLVKNPETGAFGLFALTGFRAGENLFLDPYGQWQSNYTPIDIRRRPFVAVRGQTENEGAIAIDLDDPMVGRLPDGGHSDDGRAGRQIFGSPDGQPSPLDERRAVLTEMMAAMPPTRALIDTLTGLDLLAAGQIEIPDGNGNFTLEGFYTIAPKAMTALPGGDLERLNRSGLLMAIHLLQCSMANVPVLLRKRAAASR